MEVLQVAKMGMEELETGVVVAVAVDPSQVLEVMVDLAVVVVVVVLIPGEEILAYLVMEDFMEVMEVKDAAAEDQEVAEVQGLEVAFLMSQEVLALRTAPLHLMRLLEVTAVMDGSAEEAPLVLALVVPFLI